MFSITAFFIGSHLMQQKETLDRHIGLWALIVYGVGDILSAGIYALIGKAAGEMGNAVWIAFLASMVAAGSRAFAGYFSSMVSLIPVDLVVILFCLGIAAVVIRGIRESMWMNMLCTGIEVGGLLLVISVGAKFLGTVDYSRAVTIANPSGDLSFSLILSGAVLTFYSFVGFEDMINVSEEIKNPEVTLPRGLLLAVAISSVIYVAISLIAVSVIPAAELAASSAPLVDVVRKAAPWFPPIAFGFIAMFAVANTALLNFIMGSRLIYGMANPGLMPKVLAKVNRRRSPYVASLAVLVFMLVLAMVGDISSLARATSVLLLICFMVVNVALIVLKRRKTEAKGRFEVPYLVPILGSLVCAAMLSHAQRAELKVAGTILAVIVVLYLVIKPAAAVIKDSLD